jgi:hypothetical protein
LNEDDARRLLLVRAVESEDASEAVLTREDRRQATEAALASAPPRQADGTRTSRSDDHAFLAYRSAFAYDRLAPRYPAVGQACRAAHWPRWLSWALPLFALILGIATNEIESSKRLNIIAFPLAGMLIWNLAIYALLAAGALRRLARRGKGPVRANPVAGLFARSMRPGGRIASAQPPLGAALARFGRDWLRISAPLTYSRASRTLHLAAAALAAGVLLGMYLRALGVEYRAGWESTFIGADTLHRLLGIVLGPASALSGIALPDAAQLQALRWSESARGENAAPWIHLYAVTAGLFIIGPRLLLGAWHIVRAAALRRRFPVPGTEDFYIRRLLRSARGIGSVVRVVPYSFHPPEASLRLLRRALCDLLGEKTRIALDPPISYGEEDAWLAAPDGDGEADHLILLFNLSATPEAENQGTLAAGIRQRLAKGGGGLAVLLDQSAYRQRLAGQSGAESRISVRRAAWESMLAGRGVTPLSVDLDEMDSPALSRALEGALLQAPALAGDAR